MTYGEPDWATPGASATGIVAANEDFSTPENNAVAAKPDRQSGSTLWQRLFSIFLIGLCVQMCSLGVLALIDLGSFGFDDFTQGFIATYMILFSALLFAYEFMWWCTIDSWNKVLRRNFGFIYKVTGKALYLIFVAALCIGVDKGLLGDKEWLRWFTGLSWGVAGVVLLVLTCVKPEIFGNYNAPTGGYDGSPV